MRVPFVIEVSGSTAGIVVSCKGRYRFEATSPALAGLDGRTFKTVDRLKESVGRALSSKAQQARPQIQVVLRDLY